MAPVIGPSAHADIDTHKHVHTGIHVGMHTQSHAHAGSLLEKSNPPQERDLQAFL